MYTLTRRVTLLVLLACLLPTGLWASPIQKDRSDNRALVETLLDELADFARKSGRSDPGDSEAIQRVVQLGREFRSSGPRDRQAIIRGLDRVFLAQRRPNKDGSQKTALFILAARGLGGMGTAASKPLIKWIDHGRHKSDLPLQRELILALGRTKSKLAREELRDLLKDVRPTFKSAAATGLGMFSHEPSKVRKQLFEDLMKALLQAQANARSLDTTSQEIWRAVNSPANASMRKLSHTSMASPEAWQRWWNKNKRRDWDE